MRFIATATDDTSGMERVEFFLNDELQETVYGTEPTYEWEWDDRWDGVLSVDISADAYDCAGNMASDYTDPRTSYNQKTQLSISTKDTNEIEPLDDYEEIITFIDGLCNTVTYKGIYIKRDVTFQAGENTGLEISGFYRPWNYFKEINVVYIHTPIYIGVIFSYPPDGFPSRIWGIAIGDIEWSK